MKPASGCLARRYCGKSATVIVCLTLMALTAQQAQAQFETASVLGYVHGSSGKAIAGSRVQLINTGTGTEVTVTTDGQGQFQFTFVHNSLENQFVTSRDASFNVNGQRSEFNDFLLDGLDNNAYGTSNQALPPSPDAINEFRVETNNHSAEFGRASGAVINVSVNSGTNALF